jgi:Fe-S-cluster-containing dehydrogenase component
MSDTPSTSSPTIQRRAFLEASGYALFLAALEGCGRTPQRSAMAPLKQLEGAVPGKSNDYASVCGGCTAACGLLVRNRDGRPIKLEGNPDHPLSKGGLCAVGQASVLSLYDSHRLSRPRIRATESPWTESTWDAVDVEIKTALAKVRTEGGTVRFLTDTVVSPTRRAAIERFLAGFDAAEHVTYDPLSCSAILDAHAKTHGVRSLPRYRFDLAKVIVSFDADFLGTWIAPVQFTADYQAGRVPQGEPVEMSHHTQFEARMSLTGCNADQRVRLLPGQMGLVLSHLATRMAARADVPIDAALAESPVDAETLDQLADRLWHARESALVVCGSQDVDVQILCNTINEMLGSYGKTLDLTEPSMQRQGDDGRLATLLDEIRAGKVDALLVAGANPVYDLPGGEQLGESLKDIPLTVSFSEQDDETAATAKYVCPEGHWLEQWSDAEPVAGTVSVAQPAIRPLGDTRSLLASLATWQDQPQTDYDSVQRYWKNKIFPRATAGGSFQAFWEQTVQDGFAVVSHTAPQMTSPEAEALPLVSEAIEPAEGQFTLVLYPKVGLLAGRHAENPWLQELPDPVTKATWDNYASIGEATAKELGLKSGDIVIVKLTAGDGPAPLELPVLVQPGQHEQSIAIALGYGRKGTDRFAGVGPQWLEGRPTVGPSGLVGVNAAPWLELHAGGLGYAHSGVTVTKTGRRNALARTQKYDKITVPEKLALPGGARRPNVEETTLAAYQEDPTAGRHVHHDYAELWPDDHPYKGHHWGLIVDLNKCTGCSACVIGCQAENNVPVVGKDEVRRSREMHWIRLDRYYSDHGNDVDVLLQPMMCQQCDNAPCETVCPVIATAHSSEGLNQQVYNRCVGTRYCANNCPYKVRRFNWFNYAHDDKRANLALNPDVTVRTRGVMEKCSFCVQRIQEAKLEAKRRGVPLADGDVRPACQQSCPAGALIFGDLNDPESAVAKAAKSPRCYQVLSELNVRPTVGYLRIVRNREEGERTSHHV